MTRRVCCIFLITFTICFGTGFPNISIKKMNPLTNIGSSAFGSITGVNGLLQLSAAAGTVGFVQSGTDTRIHNYFVRNSEFSPYTIPVIWGGYILPVIASSGFLTYGLAADSYEPYKVGCIIAQSTILSFGYQSIFKLVTGRVQPDSFTYSTDKESKDFRFGFNKGGIDFGWPSGLMIINTSSLVALQTVYPKNKVLKYGSQAWLTYALISISAHEKGKLAWFSDGVAGTIMGIAIGRSVGKAFNRSEKMSLLEKHVSAYPIIGSANGITLTVTF